MAVLNGGFETNTTGWVVDGTSTITRQTTTAHEGAASAVVLTDGTADHGVTAAMSGDAAQNSTWDATGYFQQHAVGDNGRHVYLQISSTGGSAENAKSSDVVLAAGWQLGTVTFQFLNGSHTAASVNVRQSGAGAAFSVDIDSITFGRHLTYAPAGVPLVSNLWLPGFPAAAFTSNLDTDTTALIASAMYAGA